MKRFSLSLAAFALSVSAFAGPPSEASIHKLLEVTKAESLVDGMLSQVEQSIRHGMIAATRGKQLTPEQRKVLDLAPAKLAAVMREEINWAHLKPAYVQIYRDVLDQSEVDGMIAFYETPAGKASVEKMPMIMQKSMAMSQESVVKLLPRLEIAIKAVLAEAGVKQ